MDYPPEQTDPQLEAEAKADAYVDSHWHNLDMFHDFLFDEVQGFTFIAPRVRNYIDKEESRDKLHTNDMLTPRTFAWMLLNFEDLKEMWAQYLKDTFYESD